MFRHIYEACAAIFLLQGALLVPLVVLAGFAWYRQDARVKAVAAALGHDLARRDRTLAALIGALPTLKPLNCPACGGAMAIDVDTLTCTSCHTHAPLPADYAATIGLRRGLRRLTRAALVHWYQAWALTAAPTQWFLNAMVIAEPALFLVLLIGAATYSDTWLDRLFERLGEHATFTLMLLGFGGFIIWMVAYILFARLAGELRRTLPPYPAIAREASAATEYGTCRACGGGIHYDARAFAALCGYCGVENYRADFGRREHAHAAGDRAGAQATLFGAMTIIEDFTSTFFVVMAILIGGFGLLLAWQALSG